MPRIEQDIKLDFRDVLIRPKRSTLRSRSQVDMNREYIFKNSQKTYCGVPIIAANMGYSILLSNQDNLGYAIEILIFFSF